MVTAAMLNDETKSSLPGHNYESSFSKSFENLRVGFVARSPEISA